MYSSFKKEHRLVLLVIFIAVIISMVLPLEFQVAESQTYPSPGPTPTPRTGGSQLSPYRRYLPIASRRFHVDLLSAETRYTPVGSTTPSYGIPGNPDRALGARIVAQTGDYNQTILIGIWDSSTGQYVQFISNLYPNPSKITWLVPDWIFKSTPDSYDVLAYYWDGTNWALADSARGMVQADTDFGEHFMWSPNVYTIPYRKMQSNNDFVVYTQYFSYFNNLPTSRTKGSERLAYMQSLANNVGGRFQVEFRRDREGWDAMYQECDLGTCISLMYGYQTNLPGGYSDATTTEENDLNGNEEAEISTGEIMSIVASSFPDPSFFANPQAYFVSFTFYRKPNYREQPVVLDTEFELIERLLDTNFDYVITTSRNEQF